MVVAFLNIVSVLAQILSRSRLGLVRLMTRLAKVRLGQFCDRVTQFKDQIGLGRGQELDK